MNQGNATEKTDISETKKPQAGESKSLTFVLLLSVVIVGLFMAAGIAGGFVVYLLDLEGPKFESKTAILIRDGGDSNQSKEQPPTEHSVALASREHIKETLDIQRLYKLSSFGGMDKPQAVEWVKKNLSVTRAADADVIHLVFSGRSSKDAQVVLANLVNEYRLRLEGAVDYSEAVEQTFAKLVEKLKQDAAVCKSEIELIQTEIKRLQDVPNSEQSVARADERLDDKKSELEKINGFLNGALDTYQNQLERREQNRVHFEVLERAADGIRIRPSLAACLGLGAFLGASTGVALSCCLGLFFMLRRDKTH